MSSNQSAPFRSRRIVVTRYGGPKVLQVVEENPPEPKPGEARVRILAAGVSYADLLMREGVHPEAPRPPFTVGWDLVGVVNRVGPGVDGLVLNQRVAALAIAVAPITSAYRHTSSFQCRQRSTSQKPRPS